MTAYSLAYIPPNLTSVIQKIRFLSASSGQYQLTDQQAINYINSYYLYDLPAQFRSLKLKDKYVFNTVYGQDTYPFDSEHYTTVEMPCYCAKREIMLYNDPWSFYGVNFNWQNQDILTQGSGDSLTKYEGFSSASPLFKSYNTDPGALNSPVFSYPIGLMQNILITANLTFGSTVNATDDGEGNIIQLFPYSESPAAGGQPPYNDSVAGAYESLYGPTYYRYVIGNINYQTGQVTNLQFVQSDGTPATIPQGNPIYINYTSQVLSIPLSILFFQNQFTVRPVPDRGYTIELIAYRSPCQALLGWPTSSGGTGTGITELSEWWELLAVGAAKKVYEDRLDEDGINRMNMMLQERLSIAETRTYAQLGKQRVNTIFQDQLQYGYGNGAGFFGAGSV